jgi:hypothetical protein
MWLCFLKVSNILGSSVFPLTRFIGNENLLPQSTKLITIDGGNHSQFSLLKDSQLISGDNAPGIGQIEQQQILIEQTLEFLTALN